MRGRKPDPQSERSLTRAKRPVQTGDVSAIPEPPEILTSDARRVWDILLPDLIGMGVYKAADGLLLVEFVELFAETAENRREARATTDKGSPEYKRIRTSWLDGQRLVNQMASDLGLNPVSRARLGLTVLKGATLLSHFEDLD